MRYFFEMRDRGGNEPDSVGIELATASHAKAEAWRTVCEVARDHSTKIEPFEFSVKVCDEQHRALFEVCLSMTGKPLSS